MIQPIAIIEPFSLIRAIVLFCSGPQLIVIMRPNQQCTVNNEELNPRNGKIIYPEHLGYYMKQELSTKPFEVEKKIFQLDKRLIQEINNTDGGYRFTGTMIDYGIENGHEMVLYNTEILENYVNKVQPRENNKLRIFARGGPLCNFFAGNTFHSSFSTLNFDYDMKEHILRLTNPAPPVSAADAHDVCKIGEHRLTGDRSEIVDFGKNNIYKVMKLVTEDYELYYSKEVDGFDGEEPIEIRGVKYCWALNPNKICYRSAALADIKKIVAMITNEEDVVHRVSIIDDFTRFDKSPETIKTTFFKEMNNFFREYIPFMKQLKSGKLTKGAGGMIIQTKTAVTPVNNTTTTCVVTGNNLDPRLWKLLNLNSIPVRRYQHSDGRKLLLCLKSPQELQEVIQKFGADAILGCFLEYQDLQVSWNSSYFATAHYWRKIIHAINPDLLQPCSLFGGNVCTFSPLFYHLPRIYDYKVFNEENWILSKAKNLLFGENKENIQILLDNLSMPLPEILAPISMTVYTQEPCEDLLLKFFGDLISFEAFDPLKKKIFCSIQLVPAEEFETTVFQTLNATKRDQRRCPQTTHLYLLGNQDVMKWAQDNKQDLQLLDKFNALDPVRKFPQKVTVCTTDHSEYERIAQILEKTHIHEETNPNLRDIYLFTSVKTDLNFCNLSLQ